jgi:hypothetical protein
VPPASSAAALASSLNSIGVEEEVAATGIKRTLLTLTTGTAATKAQQAAFKALRLDAVKVSKAMQVDSNGTIVDVFERIKGLDVDKQASLLSELFGSESLGAIAPLLTNLDGLKQRLGLVGDRTKYAGSMTKEFLARIGTTQGATDLAANALQSVNIALGQSLLPTIKAGAQQVGAFANKIGAWARANPGFAKGLMYVAATIAVLFGLFGVAAIAIAAIMGPIAILSAGLTAMGVAGGLASIGLLPIIGTVALIALGIAALGFVVYSIYSSWGAITAWFAGLWQGVKNIFASAVQWIKGLFAGFNPLFLLMGPFGAVLAWLGGPMAGKFVEIGGNLIKGLIRGVMGMLGALKSTIVNAASSAAAWFKQKLGIHSPSRVFAGFGGFMMEGLANGIASNQDTPIARIDTLSKRLTTALAVGAAMPAMAAPQMPAPVGAGVAGASFGAGGDRYEIHLHAAAGMDEAALVGLLERKLQEIERNKAARGRASLADQQDWDDHA